MRNRKNSKKKSLNLPNLKKDIKDFLLSEEGKMTKEKIAKVGIALGVLAMMMEPEAMSQTHASSFFTTGRGGHSSHASHASHASHGAHSSGGWC